MEVAIPPTVQSRPSFGSVREKRAKRTAVPILAGAIAFTTEPVQYRAAESGRDVEPPHRVSADLQAAADVSSEPAKAAPAIQIQHRRGVREPFDPRADPVTEQLRSRGEHDQCANRPQEQGKVTLSEREVEVHLV